MTFLPPYVVHDRVAHDYLKDFQSETDLQKLGLVGMVELVTWMFWVDFMVTCVFLWMFRDAFVLSYCCFAVFFCFFYFCEFGVILFGDVFDLRPFMIYRTVGLTSPT